MPGPFAHALSLVLVLLVIVLSGVSANSALHSQLHSQSHSDCDTHDHDSEEGCAVCLFNHSGLHTALTSPPPILGSQGWVVDQWLLPAQHIVARGNVEPDGRGPPSLG